MNTLLETVVNVFIALCAFVLVADLCTPHLPESARRGFETMQAEQSARDASKDPLVKHCNGIPVIKGECAQPLTRSNDEAASAVLSQQLDVIIALLCLGLMLALSVPACWLLNRIVNGLIELAGDVLDASNRLKDRLIAFFEPDERYAKTGEEPDKAPASR